MAGVTGPGPEPDRRDSARMLLFDGDDRLVLIRRVREGVPPYLVTPGGGVEEGESTSEAAVRECAEELGAVVTPGPVAVLTAPDPSGVVTFHLGVVRRFDPALRTGPELSEPGRGTYETIHVAVDDADALSLLRPEALRSLIATHGGLWIGWARSQFSQL